MDEETPRDLSERVREAVAYALRIVGPPEDVGYEEEAPVGSSAAGD
jgi:hypothetical protein